MSISMEVVGFRPADEKWEQMKAIYELCNKVHITIPCEVKDFFNGYPPDENGVRISIDRALQAWSDDGCQEIDVDLSKVPSDIKIIRFFNSW